MTAVWSLLQFCLESPPCFLFRSPRGDIINSSCPNIRTCYLFRLPSSIFIISTQPLAISVRARYEQELCSSRRSYFAVVGARPKWWMYRPPTIFRHTRRPYRPKRGWEEADGRTPCRCKAQAKPSVKRRSSNDWHETETSVTAVAT